MIDVVQLALGLRLARNSTAATYALLVYEFLIIFNREYASIYKSRWSLTKCLYLACRFGLLLGWPIVMSAFLIDHDEESCQPFVIAISVLFMLFPCFPQCICILRAYAITGAKRLSLLVYLPCLFAYLFVVCWYSFNEMILFKDGFVLLGRTACFRAFPHEYDNVSVCYRALLHHIHDLLIIIISGSHQRMLFAGIALDGIVGFMLVIHFVLYQGPQALAPLENLLITQGLIYFPLMLFLNTGAAIISTIGTFRGYDCLVFSAVIVISNIMACRFIIQIREHTLNSTYSPEMTSKLTSGVECAFRNGTSVTETAHQ